jgi:hypothetical protein
VDNSKRVFKAPVHKHWRFCNTGKNISKISDKLKVAEWLTEVEKWCKIKQ